MEWLSFIATELHKPYGALFDAAIPEEYKTIAREKLGQRLGFVEQRLADSEYVAGESFSVADAYLFVVVNWSRVTAVDLTAFPGLQRFQARIMSRPAVQAAMKAEGLMK